MNISQPRCKGKVVFCCGDSSYWIQYDEDSGSVQKNFDQWPWPNVSERSWNSAVEGLHFVKWFKDDFGTAIYFVFYILGIIGSLLIIVTIRQETYRKQMTFRVLMTATSMADLIYNAVGLPYIYVITYSQAYRQGFTGVEYFVILSLALMYFTSIFSDFATLFLTIERYLSLWKPILWHSLNRRQKTRFIVTAMLLSAVLSCLRLSEACKKVLNQWFQVEDIVAGDHNVTNSDDVHCGNREHGEDAFGTFFLGWDVISEIVLPLMLLGIMSWLTVYNVAMVRRLSRAKLCFASDSNVFALRSRRDRVHPIPVITTTSKAMVLCNSYNDVLRDSTNVPAKTVPISTNEKRKKVAEIRSITSLIFITAVSFAICQISYVFWRLLWILHQPIEMLDICAAEASYKSLMHMYQFVQLSIMSTYICEAISRSLNFYFYLLFNSPFRGEFRACIRNLLSRVYLTNTDVVN